MKNLKKKILIGAFLTCSVVAFGIASAITCNVGGGIWNYQYLDGVYAKSEYYHPSTIHSASAQVGFFPLNKDIQGPRFTARASSTGIGTTRVWWNNQA